MADKQSYSRPENLMWDGKQDDYSPVCRVTPTTSEDVAQILSVLVEEQCHFAVKSGGHSRIPNSSNSDGGVTIDLARISAVEINEKDGTAKIGSGALWLDVYKKLEEKDLMVVGGRVADVGVGGFILGGKFQQLCACRQWYSYLSQVALASSLRSTAGHLITWLNMRYRSSPSNLLANTAPTSSRWCSPTAP